MDPVYLEVRAVPGGPAGPAGPVEPSHAKSRALASSRPTNPVLRLNERLMSFPLELVVLPETVWDDTLPFMAHSGTVFLNVLSRQFGLILESRKVPMDSRNLAGRHQL